MLSNDNNFGLFTCIVLLIGAVIVSSVFLLQPRLENGTYMAKVINKDIGKSADTEVLISGDGSLIPYLDNIEEYCYFTLLVDEVETKLKVSSELYSKYNVDDMLKLKVDSGKYTLVEG